MIKILSVSSIYKFQIIEYDKEPNHHYTRIKLGDKIYKPLPVHNNYKNPVDIHQHHIAIESDDDISEIKYIEFLESV